MITISKSKVYPRMSEETTAFTALVHWEGRLLGEATNDGRGGCSYLRISPKASRADLAAADAYAQRQPILDENGKQYIFAGDKPAFFEDAADFAGHLAAAEYDRAANARKLRNLLKNRILWFIKGRKGLWQSKPVPWSDHARRFFTNQAKEKHGADAEVVFLNDLPFDEAMKQFIEHAQ